MAMAFTTKQQQAIHKKTHGKCHLCGKRRTLGKYGKSQAEGGWQIEHSVPRAKGGTDHLNNLFAACAECNQKKGTRCTRTARAEHGRTRAPLSREKKQKIRRGNAIAGGVVGGGIGLLLGPIGLVAGAVIGASIGGEIDPEEPADASSLK